MKQILRVFSFFEEEEGLFMEGQGVEGSTEGTGYVKIITKIINVITIII